MVSSYWSILRYKLIFFVLLSFIATLTEGVGLIAILPLVEIFINGQDLSQVESGPAKYFIIVLGFFEIKPTVANLLTMVGLLFLTKGVLSYITHVYGAYLRRELLINFKKKYLDAFAKVNYEYFSKQSTGYFINTFDEQIIAVVQGFFFSTKAIMHLLSVIVYTALGLYVAIEFGFALTLASLLIIVGFRLLNSKIRKKSSEFSKYAGQLSDLTVEAFQGFKYIKSTNSFENLNSRFELLFSLYGNARFYTGALAGVAHAFREPIAFIVISLLIYWQVVMAGNEFSPIMVSILLFYRGLNNMIAMQSAMQSGSEYSGAYHRVIDAIRNLELHKEDRREIFSKSFELTNEIRFNDIRFKYKKADDWLFNGIKFIVAKGSFTAIIGTSGSGKTTLISMLLGLLPVERGSIFIDGVDLSEIDTISLRDKIGIVTQEPVLFNGTILQNITMNFERISNSSYNEIKLNECLKMAQLENVIKVLPDGLNTTVGDRGGLLSGGQKQRIHIARELYREPEILIFDEATSALDTASERLIMDSIIAKRPKYTIISIAHRAAAIAKADNVIDISSV